MSIKNLIKNISVITTLATSINPAKAQEKPLPLYYVKHHLFSPKIIDLTQKHIDLTDIGEKGTKVIDFYTALKNTVQNGEQNSNYLLAGSQIGHKNGNVGLGIITDGKRMFLNSILRSEVQLAKNKKGVQLNTFAEGAAARDMTFPTDNIYNLRGGLNLKTPTNLGKNNVSLGLNKLILKENSRTASNTTFVELALSQILNKRKNQPMIELQLKYKNPINQTFGAVKPEEFSMNQITYYKHHNKMVFEKKPKPLKPSFSISTIFHLR